jgi:processive 1,2-diacylglycerol beta-glucosyltransferase
LEKVITRTYLGVVKRTPEIWDYLYDNPRVLEKTRRLRELIHRWNSPKLATLLDRFKPDAVLCTQAFPCGMIADYKKTFRLGLPLVGTLTDYAPHSYWIYNNVDSYVVPSEETGRRLIASGIVAEKVKPLGIAIDPKFNEPVDREKVIRSLGLDASKPIILIMGGTQGLGPIRELIVALSGFPQDLQLVVVCGTNRRLHRWLSARKRSFKKKLACYGFADNINELMSVAMIIVTKPGGITTAEALSKGLPMVILNPLPGQEAMNTAYLLKEEVAVKAEDTRHCVAVLEELLYNEEKLCAMSLKAKRCSKPRSALDTAQLLVGLTR